MNLLDLAIALAVIGAAVGGWRLGALARGLAWLGVAIGLVAAVPFVAPVVSALGGSDPDTRVTVALVFLVLCGAAGQVAGLGASLVLDRRRRHRDLSRADRTGGAALGAFGVLVVVWMVTPSLAVATGWPARAAQQSTLVGALDSIAPSPPDVFDAWGREVADAPYPAALDPLAEPPDPGFPPSGVLSADAIARIEPSIVRVTGVACATIQDGSGFVVGPGTIVTNAHVVAGESASRVIDAGGREHSAAVVAFDPVSDVAVLRVPEFDAPSLALIDAEPGDEAGVFGFPGGGALRIAPARVGESISARGTDIYRRGESIRDVLVLAARLAPGDSGAAVVTERGEVLGVAFAIDPGSATTAYALARSEIEPVVARAAERAVETGSCLRD